MPEHFRVLGWLMAGSLVLGISGATAAQSASPEATADGLADTSWSLTSVGDTPIAGGDEADILFTRTEAGGFGGCNRFMASYATDGVSSLTFGPIATTMKLCDDAANAFEQRYLAALAAVASYVIDDGGLAMSDASGATVLTYTPMTPASIEGPWSVTMVNNGSEAVVGVPDGIDATATFQPDGTVEGFAGCNRFSGGYSVDGDTIAIGPLMGTMMSCGETTDTFEGQYLTALEAATTWAIVSGVLELRDDDGALQVMASSATGN